MTRKKKNKKKNKKKKKKKKKKYMNICEGEMCSDYTGKRSGSAIFAGWLDVSHRLCTQVDSGSKCFKFIFFSRSQKTTTTTTTTFSAK